LDANPDGQDPAPRPLSDREMRALAALAARLDAEDPHFHDRMQRGTPSRSVFLLRAGRTLAVQTAVVVVSAVAILPARWTVLSVTALTIVVIVLFVVRAALVREE
jgi:Protein of unknown function (DUF3040)